MKKQFLVILCWVNSNVAMEFMQIFPQIDETATQLIIQKQTPTNYLHLLPREVLAKHLLPCIKVNSTSGMVVALLAGKHTPNEEICSRIVNIDREDATRLGNIPRITGFADELHKKNELDLMALNAIEKDNYSELDFFVYKKRVGFTREMRQMPLKSLGYERRLSKAMQEMVNSRMRCANFWDCYSHVGGKIINGMFSAIPLWLTGLWAYRNWPTLDMFEDCQRSYWDPLQESSRATGYPCNITQIHADQGNLWDCYDKATTVICNEFKYQQIFISCLPLIVAAFMVASVQGVLLVLRKFCYARGPISKATQEQVILYDQLITQAQEGMLPEVEEV